MEDTTMLDSSQPLFHDATFTIIPTGLIQDRVLELADTITTCGGTVVPFDISSGRIENLEEITHIVAVTTDFPDYYKALDLMIHVVKPTWVEDGARSGKTKNPRQWSPDPALFMSDVVVCCAGIPEGDQEAIQGGVLAMGGQYNPVLSKLVTHLIALDMEDPRCKLAVDKRLNLRIVLPHWFDDCLKVGRRISERPYLLPDPEILKVDGGAIPAPRTSDSIRDATDPEPIHPPSSPPPYLESAREIRAFDGKNVKLGDDLGLNDRLKGVINDLILAGGGKITSNIEEAHIYVCSYRDGDDYIKASQSGKDVGNLSWLYFLIIHDRWTNPMLRMMHYPRPRHGVPGFHRYKICISNYTGEARIYLENLIKATGAEFTKKFKQDNTHLVTAHKNSEKCEAADEWGVHVVNHLWLEESYAKCKEQTLTDPRYTYFPPRTNMGEILGTTQINRDAVEKMFFGKTTGRETSEQGGRKSYLAEKPVKAAKVSGDVATPVASKRFGGKENQTPGSRGAKDRALSRLHESADDIAKFEKEMKRKGGVIHGGRRSKEDEVSDEAKKKARDYSPGKRSIDEVEAEDATSEDEHAGAATKKKRARKDKLTPIKYRMLLSKDERWQNNDDKAAKDKARLRELGLLITEDFKKVDLLCAPKIVRTKKFVAAMACGPTLVSSTYLDYALKNDKLPPPEKYPIQDQDFEDTHGINISEAIDRAKQNKHRLLKDWTIFCTDKVAGGFETYNEIIAANGGRCQKWQGRASNVTASKRQIDSQPKEMSQNLEEDEGDVLYLISEPQKSEFKLWEKFRELAKKHDMVPRIVRTEWLLYVAMAQKMHWDEQWELSEAAVNAKV